MAWTWLKIADFESLVLNGPDPHGNYCPNSPILRVGHVWATDGNDDYAVVGRRKQWPFVVVWSQHVLQLLKNGIFMRSLSIVHSRSTYIIMFLYICERTERPLLFAAKTQKTLINVPMTPRSEALSVQCIPYCSNSSTVIWISCSSYLFCTR